jgi:hypothetical protein
MLVPRIKEICLLHGTEFTGIWGQTFAACNGHMHGNLTSTTKLGK